jgi:glycine cleavage system H lipoate-binding protein
MRSDAIPVDEKREQQLRLINHKNSSKTWIQQVKKQNNSASQLVQAPLKKQLPFVHLSPTKKRKIPT